MIRMINLLLNFFHDFWSKPVKRHTNIATFSQYCLVFYKITRVIFHAAPLPDDKKRPNLVRKRGKTRGYHLPNLVVIAPILRPLVSLISGKSGYFGSCCSSLRCCGAMKLSGQSHDKNYELSKQFCHDFCVKPVKKPLIRCNSKPVLVNF